MHSDFRAVADEFSLNFSRRREIGASLHIIQNGQTVVDLWAGQTDEETDLPWERGTLAKKEMQWQSDVMEGRMRDQIHASARTSTDSATVSHASRR